MKLTQLNALLIALSCLYFLSSCATNIPDKKLHRLDLDAISNDAKRAVEIEMKVDLSHISWETADQYRLSRLTYKPIFEEYRQMISNPYYARVLAQDVSSVSANNILGLYKNNIKTVFISPTALQSAYSYELKSRKLAREIYLALFIHEYIHAADYEKFSENLASEKYIPGQDELLGAMMEGNAEYLSEKLCKKVHCETGYKLLDEGSNRPSSKPKEKQKKLSKIYREELKFKYDEGKKFITGQYNNEKIADPIPRNRDDLPDSSMLIYYPDNEKLKNSEFTLAQEILNGLDLFKTHYINADFIYHFEVYTPPRTFSRIRELSDIDVKRTTNNPFYYQAAILKVKNLSEKEFYYSSGNIAEFLLIDMGSDRASKGFYQKVKSNWSNEKSIYSDVIDPTGEYLGFSYRLNGNETRRIFQFGNFILLSQVENSFFDEARLQSYADEVSIYLSGN